MHIRVSHALWAGVALALSIGLMAKGNTVDSNLAAALRVGELLRLNAGRTAENPAERIRLTFETVAGESRCPTGARCAWEGNARAVFLFSAPEGSTRFELNTSSRFDRHLSCFGYTIRLEGLAPHPALGSEIAAADYVATVRVTRP